MTRDEFLARCATIYDTGRARPELFRLMGDWLDAMMRLEHTFLNHLGGGQGQSFLDFIKKEEERLGGRYQCQTLASDRDGYALQEIAAILSHPCQKCAESKEAWWTRPGFCTHKDRP